MAEANKDGPMGVAPILEAKTISKTYLRPSGSTGGRGAHKALDAVSFVMNGPERIALIGPSGSGKSTLLKSLSGLLVLDEGSGPVTAFGQTVQQNGHLGRDVRKIRSRIGMIAQQFNLVGRLTLFTNAALGLLGRISFWRGLFGIWNPAEKQKIMAALDHVGVAPMASQRANTLSGGQQQRGAIARAMVQGAEVVLADEPVASLDPVTARRVMELLVDLNETQNVGVVVTLHQVDYAMKYCERILALKDGKVVYDGPCAGLGLDQLKTIYGAEIESAFWGDVSHVS